MQSEVIMTWRLSLPVALQWIILGCKDIHVIVCWPDRVTYHIRLRWWRQRQSVIHHIFIFVSAWPIAYQNFITVFYLHRKISVIMEHNCSLPPLHIYCLTISWAAAFMLTCSQPFIFISLTLMLLCSVSLLFSRYFLFLQYMLYLRLISVFLI